MILSLGSFISVVISVEGGLQLLVINTQVLAISVKMANTYKCLHLGEYYMLVSAILISSSKVCLFYYFRYTRG
jgi:hypothetical protein